MKIRLFEISENGEDFFWDSQSGELNDILKDIIGCQKYETKFNIKPMNNKNFVLTGSITSTVPEQCSLCCEDFKMPISTSFHEILVPKLEEGRTDHYTKANHITSDHSNSDQLGSTEYVGTEFDMGEFLHEALAIEVPLVPVPEQDSQGNCSSCGENIKNKSFSYIEDDSKLVESPFSALKNIKLI